jgi:hypothetical protein
MRNFIYSIGLKLDAERVHVAIGLANGERMAGIPKGVHSLACHLLRFNISRARNDGIRLKLIVHESSKPLPQSPAKFYKHAQSRHNLALFYRIDNLLINARLLREIIDAPIMALSKYANTRSNLAVSLTVDIVLFYVYLFNP